MNDALSRYSCEEIKEKVFSVKDSYVYFSEEERNRYEDTLTVTEHEDRIFIPISDIMQTINALCLSIQGKACSVSSPVYESNYIAYPALMSAVPLLLDSKSYYLIAGNKRLWEKIISCSYRHGTVGNHPLMKRFVYRTISDINESSGNRMNVKSGKAIKWITSGLLNTEQWQKLNNISLIIADLTGENQYGIQKTDIENILNYSKSKSLPVIFFKGNNSEKISKYLCDLEVIDTSWSFDGIGEVRSNSVLGEQLNTKDDLLRNFISIYNQRSLNISKFGIKKRIYIKLTAESVEFKKVYHTWVSLLKSVDLYDHNKHAKYVTKLSSKLLRAILEFPGQVSKEQGEIEWRNTSIGMLKEDFYRNIWSLNENSMRIARELNDNIDQILKKYEVNPTPLGKILKETVIEYLNSGKEPVLLGDKDLLTRFFMNDISEETGILFSKIVSVDHLEEIDYANPLIKLGPFINNDKTKLLTSRTNNLVLLIYPWLRNKTENAIKEVQFLIKLKTQNHDTGIENKEDKKMLEQEEIIEVNYEGKEGEFISEREELPELFESAEEEDNDEFETENLSIFDGSHYLLNNGEPDYDKIPKWIVSLGEKDTIIPENRRIIVLTDEKATSKSPKQLKPGDRILITKDFNPRSISDFIWEIMEKRMKIKRSTHPGNQWRIKLIEYKNDQKITSRQIFERLQNIGNIGIMTPVAVYLWLINDEVIGPLDRNTLNAIARLVGQTDKIMEWQQGIKYIRSLHNKLIRHLWRIVEYNANGVDGKFEDDYMIDEKLGIKASELSKLILIAKVSSLPRRIED